MEGSLRVEDEAAEALIVGVGRRALPAA